MNWIKRLGAAVGLLLITSTVYAGANFSRVKTWTSREILTYSNLNAEFDNILTNFTPSGMDDYSASVSQMRTTADPYPSSAESLPTSLAGELERIRYVLAQITGETYWYQDPDTSLATVAPSATNVKRYGQSNLVVYKLGASSISITADYLDVEDTAVVSISTVANLATSGEFGLDAGTELSNQWYSIWALYNPTSSSYTVVMSSQVAAVTLPSGFTKKRRIGFFYNNSTGDINDFRVMGNEFNHYSNVGQYLSINGAPTVGSWTDVTLSTSGVPAVEAVVDLRVQNDAGAGGASHLSLAPKGHGWTAGVGTRVVTSAASGTATGSCRVRQNSSRVIQYHIDANGSFTSIGVVGFTIPPL